MIGPYTIPRPGRNVLDKEFRQRCIPRCTSVWEHHNSGSGYLLAEIYLKPDYERRTVGLDPYGLMYWYNGVWLNPDYERRTLTRTWGYFNRPVPLMKLPCWLQALCRGILGSERGRLVIEGSGKRGTRR